MNRDCVINMENMLHIKFTLTIFIRQSTRHNDIYYIFYLGLAMASAGIIFTRNYLFYSQLIEKRVGLKKG